MLNLQFEETMKLTEEELQVVSGGDLVYTGNTPGSGIGTSQSIANFWRAFFTYNSPTVNRRRY
ncbi:peptide pheromone VP1 [Streptococcus pneumoniae]|nr:peptide pheromone VP1 [Streptococcus pneumoniae]